MTGAMHMRVVTGLALVVAVAPALAGCPSKEGERKDAQTSSSGTAPAATGPLAGLETSASVNEPWMDEAGQAVPMIYYTRENIRVSASCRLPDGKLACDALRFLRSGVPVEMPRQLLDGRTSAGVKVCRKMNLSMVMLHNSVGSSDGMCKFPDGSLLANGSLEQYGMHVIE
jgi:putative hemolysin